MRNIADFSTLKCIGKLDYVRRGKWEQLARMEQPRLDGSPFKKEVAYTSHDFSHHCFNIYKIISDILINPVVWGDSNGISFSDVELYLLDVAVLYHDYSMIDSEYLKSTQKSDCRYSHSDKSANMFDNMCKNIPALAGMFSNPTEIKTVCDIIRAHSDIKIFNKQTNTYESTSTLDTLPVINASGHRVRMLAGILRIADELDVTIDRFPPEYLSEISALATRDNMLDDDDRASIAHWNKLKCFKEISIDENTREAKLLVNNVDGNYLKSDNSEFVTNLNEVLRKTNEQLSYVKRVCMSRDFANFVVCNKIKADFSEFFNDDKDVIACRTKIFYEKVLPFLLNECLPVKACMVYNKLYPNTVSSFYSSVLPFISLASQEIEPKLIPRGDNRRFVEGPENVQRYFEFMSWRSKPKDVKLFEGDTYILDSVNPVTNEMFVHRSSYFQVHGTSDVNFFNLVRFFPDEYFYTTPKMDDIKRRDLYPKFYDELNLWIKQLCTIVQQQDSFRFSDNLAGLGVSILTVVKRDNVYMYPISKNSEQKAAGGYDCTVIPAGAYQPCNWDYTTDMDPRLQVLREFGEELLDLKELRNVPDKSLRVVLEEKQQDEKTPAIFKQLINDILNNKVDNVKLVYTGVALDILRMRPEITYLLVLEGSDYADTSSNDPPLYGKNWEADHIEWVPLSDDETFSKLVSRTDSPLVPSGLAALIWGRAKAKNIKYLWETQ